MVGLFLASSWGVLQAVEFLTDFAGRPDWAPAMALVLLMIGLPIGVATAFVQEGVPGHDAAPDVSEPSGSMLVQHADVRQWGARRRDR